MATSNFNSNSQRDSRLLYLRNRASQQEAVKTSGAPQALEEVVVEAPRPTFAEIQTHTRQSEVDFATREAANALKSTAANLAGLPADLFNLVNSKVLSGTEDFSKGTSAYFKKLLGVDPGSFGDIVGDVNPMDGLATGVKVASNVAPLVQAGMLVPISMWHNAEEAAEAERIIKETMEVTGMTSVPVNSSQWVELNKQLFEKTGGWMVDFNNNIRRWFAPKEGGLNPKIIKPDGTISVGTNTTLEELIAPEVWGNFDPATIEYLKKIPVGWISHSRGEWSNRKGIGLMMTTLYKDPAQFLSSLHHELGHGFDLLAGSGAGGSAMSAGQKAAGEARNLVFDALYGVAKQNAREQEATALREAIDRLTEAQAFKWKIKQSWLDAVENGKKVFGEAMVNNYVNAATDFNKVYHADYQAYLRLSSEVMNRAIGAAREQSVFPLGSLDVPVSEITKVSSREPTAPRNLPQRQSDGTITVGNVVTELLQRSEDPRKLEAEVQAGKWDDEIQRLLREQKADELRDHSRFKDPALNAELEEARQRLGVSGPVPRVRGERINDSFPTTTDRPTLMRPRDSQGARLDDSRGGPPSKYEGFGQMMDGAERLAVGREEVWKSGRFDIEAYQNKVESIRRNREILLAKGDPRQRRTAVRLEPKFWALDPDTNQIMVVTAKQGGGFDIARKTGPKPKDYMDKVDLVATREGLNEFISKVLWKRATGEPITYLEP